MNTLKCAKCGERCGKGVNATKQTEGVWLFAWLCDSCAGVHRASNGMVASKLDIETKERIEMEYEMGV